MAAGGGFLQDNGGRLLLVAGTALLYAASRLGADAFGGGSPDAPGRRAVGHWLPIAAAAVGAMLMRQPDVAMALAFSTSVASLSLVTGAVTFAPATVDAPPEWRRLWALTLPVALMVVIAGLSGHLSPWHALALAIEGAVIFWVWNDPARRATPDARGRAAAPDAATAGAGAPRGRPGGADPARITACAALSLAGAACAVYGAVHVGQRYSYFSLNTVTAMTLGVLLVAPMIVVGARPGRADQAWSATTTNVGVVFLNLCLLLPLLAVLWYPASAGWFSGLPGQRPAAAAANAVAPPAAGETYDPSAPEPASQPATRPAPAPRPRPAAGPPTIAGARPLAFPASTWRVDAVMLVILAFALAAAASGRLRLGPPEAVALVLLYLVYAVMEAIAGARP